MNDYRGLLIREERKKSDISLEALSHGICSPSYLSKIENNILIANDDIYDLLLRKLGINIMDKAEEENVQNLLDLFFRYYMSSDQKIFKITDKLLEYKSIISASRLFIQYQLFLLYASEMNHQINISIEQVEEYYSYMDEQQKEYLYLFKLSAGDIALSENDDWFYIRKLKAKANLYMYQKHIFKAYDLYKTCLNHAVELGNKALIAEILCSLGWLCLELDLAQAEKFYLSAVNHDSKYKPLAFYNLGATMMQHKDYLEKGNRYLNKGLKHCTDEFIKTKYKEALFIYSVLYGNKNDAEKIIQDISDSKYFDIFSIMLSDDYQLNPNYQKELKKSINDSSLMKFLFVKSCESLHKYKDIYVLNKWS